MIIVINFHITCHVRLLSRFMIFFFRYLLYDILCHMSYIMLLVIRHVTCRLHTVFQSQIYLPSTTFIAVYLASITQTFFRFRSFSYRHDPKSNFKTKLNLY